MAIKKILLLAGQAMLTMGYAIDSEINDEIRQITDDETATQYDHNTSSKHPGAIDASETPFTFIYYIVTFVVLVIFFAIMAWTDGICKKSRLDRSSKNTTELESPPDYEQFAPPSYESVIAGVHQHGRSSTSKSTHIDEIKNDKVFIISENVR